MPVDEKLDSPVDSAHHTSTPDFVSFVNDKLSEDPNYHCCPPIPRLQKPIGETLPEVNHTCFYFKHAPLLKFAEEYHASPESAGHISTTVTDVIATIFACFLVFFSPLLLLLYVLPRAIWIRTLRGTPPYFEFPVKRWAHLAALWLVYVPEARVRAYGGLLAIIAPTESRSFQHAQMKAILRGNALMKTRIEKRDDLKKLIYRLEVEESQLLKEVANVPPGASYHDSIDSINRFRRNGKDCRLFKQYLTELEKEIEEIHTMALRQATYERTGYQGVGDWCQDILNAYGTVITSLATVCALGIGLTYATIFSAIRGDITYMQWAFSLFIIGLSIVTFIQGMLQWGTTLPQYSFLAIGLWESLVAIAIFSAITNVVSAFCLLLISVYRFHLVEGDGIQTSGSSQTPAIVAFTAIGISLGIVVVIFLLFAAVHGVNALLWERSLIRSQSRRKLLEDYSNC